MKLPFEKPPEKKRCFPISTRLRAATKSTRYMCKFQILPNSKEHPGWFPKDPNERCGLSRWFISSFLVFVGLPWSRFSYISLYQRQTAPIFIRVSPTSKMSNICMRSCIGTLATFGWLWSLPGWIDWSVRFCFGSPGISVWRTFFPWNSWFSKAKISLQREHGMWVSLKVVRHEGVHRNSSNHIKWVWFFWFEQFFSWCLAKTQGTGWQMTATVK